MNFRNFLFVLLIGCSAYAQELEDPNLFATNNQIIRADLYSGHAVSLSQFDGYIKPERTQFTLPQGNVYEDEYNREINMMEIAASERWKRQSGIVDMDFPTRQLQQINSNVQVFYNNRENFKYRTNFNMNYDGQRTPDGGIRNEVYQDVSQPLINPYYMRGFSPYQRRRGSGNFGFYMTR